MTTHLYADIAAPLVITLVICATVCRRTGDITPRMATGLEALAAAGAATYTYLAEDWPWDAINILITLMLVTRWAAYPTKREREQQQ
ncbi:hypothetical protein ACUXZZ_45250 (plasmid) [Streptomyces graminifolii]|uniref:hypothetical protein n=1 Tax=Streptomyces graminifolii TaxID=1266771 RepID=UPI004058F400